MYTYSGTLLDEPTYEENVEPPLDKGNGVEYGVLEPFHWRENWFSIALALTGAVALTAIYIPYREIIIPHMFLWILAMCLAMMCLKFSQENFNYLLIVFAVYAPFQKIMPGDFGGLLRAFNITNVILFFLFLGWISKGSLRDEGKIKFAKFDVLILLFMFVSTLSLAYGYYLSGEAGVQSEHLAYPLKRWLEPMIVYFIFVNNLDDRRGLTEIVNVCLMSFFFCTIIGLKEFYLDKGGLYGDFSSLERMRISGIADQPNDYAAFFCYYSFFYLAMFLGYMRNFRYWMFLPGFVLAYQAMHLCFSRGGQLGFLAGTLATCWFWNRKVFLFCLVPLLFMLIINPDLIPARFKGRMSSVMSVNPNYTGFEDETEHFKFDKTANHRLLIWQGAREMALEHPLFGVGFGRFRYNIGKYIPETLALEAHSTYFQIACEMGIPALLLFLTILVWGLMKAWYVYQNTEILYFRCVAMGYMGGWFALMVVNVFGSRLNVNEVIFYYWILTAIIVKMQALTKIEMERRAAIAPPPEPTPTLV